MAITNQVFFMTWNGTENMSHCTSCSEVLVEVEKSDTSAKFSDATVWECTMCGAILGVTQYGV
ncbi:hypothetical protein C440_09908 [Haloferax mucosum ATCC BAA-1512]|uniref:Uncharacterized protein n=1 Tax=Haloferax mucosum ATCC BAA-1512 TaxID=662479 RepID=M0IGB6_9EURY|nr:hypothetical protein C440_09908 [Haloferax mucosum ATCC BAA-1512]